MLPFLRGRGWVPVFLLLLLLGYVLLAGWLGCRRRRSRRPWNDGTNQRPHSTPSYGAGASIVPGLNSLRAPDDYYVAHAARCPIFAGRQRESSPSDDFRHMPIGSSRVVVRGDTDWIPAEPGDPFLCPDNRRPIFPDPSRPLRLGGYGGGYGTVDRPFDSSFGFDAPYRFVHLTERGISPALQPTSSLPTLPSSGRSLIGELSNLDLESGDLDDKSTEEFEAKEHEFSPNIDGCNTTNSDTNANSTLPSPITSSFAHPDYQGSEVLGEDRDSMALDERGVGVSQPTDAPTNLRFDALQELGSEGSSSGARILPTCVPESNLVVNDVSNGEERTSRAATWTCKDCPYLPPFRNRHRYRKVQPPKPMFTK